MNRDLAIQTTRLSKTFHGKEAVSAFDLAVETGNIYGLLGKNGAGKTTLFKMLLGLLKPANGEIFLLGKDIRIHMPGLLRQVGALIEAPVFYEHLSAKENLSLYLEYMEVQGNIQKTLDMTGLSADSSCPVSDFSLGMRQRLGIARAIVARPKLLILDEPVNGLDPAGIREMRDLFLYLARQEKTTILLSSHILSEVKKIADRVGFMAEGRLLEEISPKQLKASPAMDLEDYFLRVTEGRDTK